MKKLGQYTLAKIKGTFVIFCYLLVITTLVSCFTYLVVSFIGFEWVRINWMAVRVWYSFCLVIGLITILHCWKD